MKTSRRQFIKKASGTLVLGGGATWILAATLGPSPNVASKALQHPKPLSRARVTSEPVPPSPTPATTPTLTPAPPPTSPPAPPPTAAPTPTRGTGSLRFTASYGMGPAPNEPQAGAAAPFFGKHEVPAYNSVEKSMYLFGGDGTSMRGVGADSHCWHFGRVWLTAANPYNAEPPVFDHFYPYRGISGRPVPVGYDCVPMVYDPTRNCMWQIGGYQWGKDAPSVVAENWIGRREDRGVWKFDCGDGTWTHVSLVDVPNSLQEGMTALYYPRLDMVVGCYQSVVWWYRCSDDARGSVSYKDQGKNTSPIGQFGPLAYDQAKDEILLANASGWLFGLSMTNFPTSVTSRVICAIPTPDNQNGQFPTLFIPSRRELILFYAGMNDDVPNNGTRIVNVDTGTVVLGPSYPQTMVGFINEAVYSPEVDAIFGVEKNSSTVWRLDWGTTTQTASSQGWMPDPGHVAAVGSNTLADINPCPNGNCSYGHGSYANVLTAWGGSAYASEFSIFGAILVHNGGDGDYWGNQVSAFDFQTLSWRRLTEPYSGMSGYPNDASYDATRGLHAPGQPSVPHGYDTAQYVPPSTQYPKGRLAYAVRLYCYGPRTPLNASYFDLDGLKWDVANDAVQRRINPPNTATTIYDPTRKRIWYRGDGTTDRIGFVDVATLNHDVVNTAGFVGQDGATSCYDPLRDTWVTLGFQQMGTYTLNIARLANISAGFSNIPLTGAALPTDMVGIPGFDWCPPLDAGFAYFASDPQAVYKFTPGNQAWTVTRIVMGGVMITQRMIKTYSKWRWASKLGAFYLLTDIHDPVWIYRPT